MVNIYSCVKSLKVAWMRQLVKGHNQKWFKLIERHSGNMFDGYI